MTGEWSIIHSSFLILYSWDTRKRVPGRPLHEHKLMEPPPLVRKLAIIPSISFIWFAMSYQMEMPHCGTNRHNLCSHAADNLF